MDRSPPLRLGFAGLPETPVHHLSVDGMTPDGPNLSHWPGNRTPRRWKADLSTGICLRFSRAAPRDQEAFLAGAEVVLNDHYDTDGFLSLLAVLRPDVAREREELCLAAAATGDYQAFQTPRAFAVDRIVAGLGHPESPAAAEFAGLDGPEKSFHRYRWLLEHAGEVLDHPEASAPLYEPELAAVQEELDACLRGGLQRRIHPPAGLAVAVSGPVRRMTLNTLAGAYRVLHAEESADGTRFRYHDRTESWFDVVTFTARCRVDLRPLATRLAALENDGEARWCADPPTEPVPELYFGIPTPQAYGEVTRELRPSRLSLETVERTVAGYLSAPSAAD